MRTFRNKILIIILIIIVVSLSLCLRYRPGKIVNGYTRFGKSEFNQLRPPGKGEEIAIIKTNAGDIKIRLFPDVAPLAVENFKTLANEGFYDGYAFDRIEEEFLIQIGTSSSFTGKSIYGDYFEREISEAYHHFTGAVGAGGNEGGNSSSFYIICNNGIEPAYLELMSTIGIEEGYTPELIKAYANFGGVPRLDNDYTVFGQVFYGMDTALEINGRPLIFNTDTGSTVTLDPVVIETIEIVPYGEE